MSPRSELSRPKPWHKMKKAPDREVGRLIQESKVTMNRVTQDRSLLKYRKTRSFPPYSQALSLAVNWVLSAPAHKRACRLSRAAIRCAELLGKRPQVIALWLWEMVGLDTLTKLKSMGGLQ